MYQISVSKLATKEILKLSDTNATMVFKKIKTLETEPKPIGHKKLKGIYSRHF